MCLITNLGKVFPSKKENNNKKAIDIRGKNATFIVPVDSFPSKCLGTLFPVETSKDIEIESFSHILRTIAFIKTSSGSNSG